MNNKEIRKKLFEVAINTGQAHLGGALSSVEILLALYNHMNISPDKSYSIDRDRLIYSKGHCPLALYTILSDKGFFSKEELEKYGSTIMPGHSDSNTPGVEMTAGSLGHGLSYGCGIALSGKLDKEDFKTYVVLGDTECNEGSIWEGAMFASSKGLSNLIVILDNNRFGVQELTENYTGKGKLKDKWLSFDWDVYEVDGHNIEQITETLNIIKHSKIDKPHIIIANTIKGKGISFMENNPKWHHGIPKDDELIKARGELNDIQ